MNLRRKQEVCVAIAAAGKGALASAGQILARLRLKPTYA